MAETDTGLNGRLPAQVTLTTADQQVGFTPREVDMIKERYGKGPMALLADETAVDERLIALGWLKLRRQGYRVTWDDMDDIVVMLRDDEPPDPTIESLPAGSPVSATSGE